MDFGNFTQYSGTPISDFSPNSLAGVPGFSPLRKKLNAVHQIKVAEAAKLWAEFLGGHVNPFLMREAMNPSEDFAFRELSRRCPHIFHEAMTRSDFLNLTTYVLDRLMLQNYGTFPKTYDQVCRVHRNVRDFRTVERWVTEGGESVYQKVGEMEGFNRKSVSTGKWTYKVAKYEGGDQISWEAVINDDMDMFNDLPKRLTLGGIRTVEQFYLNLIADSDGPHASMYGAAIALPTDARGSSLGTVNNIITVNSVANPALNVQNLIGAIGQFMNLMTAEGRPIDVANDDLILVVADGILWSVIQNIINTNQIVTQLLGGKASSVAGGYPDIALQTRNWISGRLKPVYAPELRNIMSSNSATSWWLFCRPAAARPAIEIGFLSGYEAPQLYRKLPNTVRVGGGSVDEMGDFETMSTEFKGLVVVGGTRMDPRMTMASDGTGS